MKRGICLIVSLLACFSCPIAFGQLPAFPGADGFGKFTTGGRGGTVYHVTTTNDSGAGSFRDAVSVSGRTVVFDIGGIIDYQPPRYAPKSNITIAGQTAPGDGVTIYGDGLSFSGSDNNICRFLRVREGINGTSDTDAVGIANGHDMIFDHMTVSWGRDETFSVSGDVTNISIQSTIISQGLQGHSAGGLIQTEGGVSIFRCLYIDNDTRNPKVKFVNEFVNNVVCNWETIGYNMGGDSAGDSYANAFNNYFVRGQASSSSAFGGGNSNFHIYATNNWLDSNRNGVLDGTELSIPSYGSMDLQATPFAYPIVNAVAPLTALKLAISDAGVSFRRDSVDELMISELTSWGLAGGTITSEFLPPMNGPGIIRNGLAYPDTDQDGMPDYWENGTGSNPAVANNNDASPSGSGYTRLEDYLNWLAEPHGVVLMNTNVVIDLRQFTRGWAIIDHSPAWSVNNPSNGTVSLVNPWFARFTPTPALNGRASFQLTVTDSDGEPFTRTMNLFFTPSAQSYQPVWHGDDLTNNWNVLGDFNWHDGVSLLYPFHNNDAVLFNDSGSANPAVNLIGSLQPASVTVAAAKDFTFSGSGSLDGSMALNKTNTGTLTIANANNFSGPTTVSNGALFVHGSLRQSPVTVKSSGSVGGTGSLGNGLSASTGSSVVPGGGVGLPGTLTITNGLTESGGVTNRFDFSDDPTGTTKTNDVIRVIGDLNLSGVNVIKVNLLDSLPGNGVYTLFTYTGTLNGSLANLSVAGVVGTLTNPPNAIAIIVNATRPPATLVWTGNGGNNFWDTGTTFAWLNGAVPDRFFFLDDVVFNNTGATNLTANLVGDLTPNSVTVGASVNYNFSGSGRITGSTGVTKTNTGTLTISTTNDFTGPVVLDGGVLSVSRLANGGAPSGIGAASLDSANLALNGTLRYTGNSVSTDRGSTLNGAGAVFDVTSGGTTLTWNGTNIGSGALIKNGPGTFTLSADNSFSGGTILSNGTLALFGPSGGSTITANNYGLGSGSVTLYGGTLKLFGGGLGDAGAGYGTFSRPLVVPTGATTTILTPARYSMNSTLSGAGILNLEVNYVRGSLNGNWSGFTGTINVTAAAQAPGNGVGEFRIANSSGYAGATIFLNDGAKITRSGGAITIEIGALAGTSGGIVGPGNDSSSGSSYRVGWNNSDATFAGQLQADGANTFTKVGTGNWTLTGANSYSGGTIVSAGTLTVNNVSGSGTGSGAVTVSSGATFAGNGSISGAVAVNSGAKITPGTSIGTLTVGSATLNSGSTTFIEINKTSATRDQLNAQGTLTYGGTLIVTNLSGVLTNGDSFKIFNASSYAGAFASSNLPPLAADLKWNTASLNTSGTLSVVSTNFAGPQPLTWVGDGTTNLWDLITLNWLATNGVPRAFVNGDSVTFNNAGDNSPPINLVNTVTPGAVAFIATQDYTLSGPGSLAGTMSLTKSGTGRLTLTTTNTFTGPIVVSGGTLQVGDGVANGGIAAGSITNNAALVYANPGPINSAAVIRGTGSVTKNSAGALSFSNPQTYTGLTIVNAGSVSFVAPPPGDITNNALVSFVPSSTLNYVNNISGSGALNINASQTITMSGASSYSGGTTNTSATLQISNHNALGSGVVVYVSGSVKVGPNVVVTNDFSIPGSATTDLSMDTFGNGTSTWAGNIVNLGSNAQWRPGGTAGTLVFTGTANQGSHNFIIPRGTVQIASNAVVNATGPATSFCRNNTGNSANVTIRDNATVNVGAFSLGGTLASGGTMTLTIRDNAAFSTGANNFDLHNSTAAAAISVLNLNGGTLTVFGFIKTRTGATQFATNNFNGGVLKANGNNSGFLPPLSGLTAIVKAGGAIIDDNGSAITIGQPFLHDPVLGGTADGGLAKFGAGILTFTGPSLVQHTYTGPTMVYAGTLAFTGGSITSSPSVYTANGATIDFGPTIILGSGKLLWGNGAVKGAILLGNGATLAPGSNSIGRLSFSNSLTFASGSTGIFEIRKSPLTNDSIKVVGALSNGGTLIVTNIGGAALTAGDSFDLFDAANHQSAFASVILPPLNPGLVWNTNALNSAGVISVINGTPPIITSAVISGNTLVLSGSNGIANATYYVLGSTNLSLPVIQWTPLFTNQFDSNGNFSYTNLLNPGVPQKYYLLQVP